MLYLLFFQCFYTLREALPDAAHVTGPAGIIADTVAVFAQGDRVLMAGTVLLVLVILLVVYRAPMLAILPLVAVTVALMFTQAIGALLARITRWCSPHGGANSNALANLPQLRCGGQANAPLR